MFDITDLHQDDSVEVVMRQTELNFCQRIVSFYEAAIFQVCWQCRKLHLACFVSCFFLDSCR